MIDTLAADKLRELISAWIEQQNAEPNNNAPSPRWCDFVEQRLSDLDSRLARLESGGQQFRPIDHRR